jgi:hypothetical protein
VEDHRRRQMPRNPQYTVPTNRAGQLSTKFWVYGSCGSPLFIYRRAVVA